MKTNTPVLLGLLLLLNFSCQTMTKQSPVEKWKQEIMNTEKAFNDSVQVEGISKAFIAFAADSVAILRNDSLIVGKAALKEFYGNRRSSKNITLTWKPDFVDVSASGDLGYTYGSYLYTVTDSGGNKKEYRGIFHTVWKRQADGKWRFVWD